jgi:hypothetical protein
MRFNAVDLTVVEIPLWLLVHTSPVKSNNEVVMLYLLLFRDITALKQPIPEHNGKGWTMHILTMLYFVRNIDQSVESAYDSTRAAA